MDDIARIISDSGVPGELSESISRGRSVTVSGAAGSGAAVLVAALQQRLDASCLVICPGVQYAEEFAEDVAVFDPDIACCFPALESAGGEEEGAEPVLPADGVSASRMKVLRHLLFGSPAGDAGGGEWFDPRPGARLVCTSINAAMQPVPDPEELARSSLLIREGAPLSPRELVERLVDSGFISMPQVSDQGQYSLRGGILDVYPFGADMPVRLEFFGDMVDSMRGFNPADQLSRGRLSEYRLLVSPLTGAGSACAYLSDYLPEGDPVILIEPSQLRHRGIELSASAGSTAALYTPGEIEARLRGRPVVSFVPAGESADSDALEVKCELRDSFGVDIKGMVAELRRISGLYDTYVLCMRKAEEERLDALLRDEADDIAGRLSYRFGRLNHGVVFPALKLALLPHHRLFGRYTQRRILRHEERVRPVSGVEQLHAGDYVVHVRYGIGRFRGMQQLSRNGRKREYLEIEFAGQVKIYVPADRLDLVHRYVGVGGRAPQLSRIRGGAWLKKRRRAEQAAEDFAAELLHLHAVRQTKKGIAHPADKSWQKQFEAEFPYDETEDQLTAVDEVKKDMEAARPMDRLICGDVGYGKTEIAMRAAFKCVMGGRQAALVAPTTVLVQQHRRTFSERMADYPVNIEMLSRFVPPARTGKVLDELGDGKVDIVIGTHRLLQKDVRFKDLGLLIIDEEQRFGVKHKERLKKMRASVDILTLTATPIPRTLHMAMMGLRDISSLQTPPQSRRAVETHVERYDSELVRSAILRELNREGQVYFVHNRVNSIDAAAARVRKLVPEAAVAVGHGRMPEQELAGAMDAFSAGRFDVLVCTTIIENGLDIPNANTLIVDRAELLGLAEMHQLRGRVGRYIHKAYAYFLMPGNRPVTPEARKRLDAIRRYHELGAGFDIALRDLELRGAGNLLGPEQSGHIAAVGYNLYCRMLSRAHKQLKGEEERPPPDVNIDIGMEALLDESYVPSLEQRIALYRRLGGAVSLEDIRETCRNMEDRFGPAPERARNLLLEAELRILAHQAGLDTVQLREGSFYLGVGDLDRFRAAFAPAPAGLRLIGGEFALLPAPARLQNKAEAGEYLKSVLA